MQCWFLKLEPSVWLIEQLKNYYKKMLPRVTKNYDKTKLNK